MTDALDLAAVRERAEFWASRDPGVTQRGLYDRHAVEFARELSALLDVFERVTRERDEARAEVKHWRGMYDDAIGQLRLSIEETAEARAKCAGLSDLAAEKNARAEAAESSLAALVAGIETVTSHVCHEWPDDSTDRCDQPAEFILWGKLFKPEALGPRCYDHAVAHTGHSMPPRADQWAVVDLRRLRALVASTTGRSEVEGQ